MKKLMFGMAVAAGLMACADIESANTVGYTTAKFADAGWQILSAQFETTSGEEIKLDDLVKGDFAGVDYDEDFAFVNTAPQIQVLTPSGYTYYYYLNDGWYDNGTEEGDYKSGWCDKWGSIVEDTLPVGTAFWFNAKGKCDITTAGQVIGQDTASVDVGTGWNLVGNAYPALLNLNAENVRWTGIVGSDYDESFAFQATAPQIQVLTDAGYSYYYYLNDGWFDNGTEEGDYKSGWCDKWGTLVGEGEAIQPGQGFWLMANEKITAEFGL